MRIALCISGEKRSWEKTYPTLQTYLLDRYPEVDIFEVAEGQRLPETDLMQKRRLEPARSLQNVLSMFWKVYQCNELKCQKEQQEGFQYDLVIRTRFDLLYHHPIKLLRGEFVIPRYGDFPGVNGTFLVPGINDQFAYGPSEAMNYYASLYLKIDEYLRNDSLFFHPEAMLRHHLETGGLKVYRQKISYDILRLDGTILNNYRREPVIQREQMRRARQNHGHRLASRTWEICSMKRAR